MAFVWRDWGVGGGRTCSCTFSHPVRGKAHCFASYFDPVSCEGDSQQRRSIILLAEQGAILLAVVTHMSLQMLC